MSNPKSSVTTVNENQGQSISVVGDTYRVIISGKQTDNNYAVIDMLVPPNGGPGPHAHPDIQESFYIVEGEISFETESGSYIAKKGSFVNIPLGGIVHCFKNKTNTTAHLLCTVFPAGLEAFFQEIGKPVDANTFLPPPDLSSEEKQNLETIAEKYGQKLYPPDFFG